MRLDSIRKSTYKQASISLICSGLVPQSQAITTTSQSPETHLKGNKPIAMHCHTYAICTPMPLHHACAPWRLGMTVLWKADRPNTFLLLSMSTLDTCMSFQYAERVEQQHCVHGCSNAFVYRPFDCSTKAAHRQGCTPTRLVSSSRQTWSHFAIGGVLCTLLQLIIPMDWLRAEMV